MFCQSLVYHWKGLLKGFLSRVLISFVVVLQTSVGYTQGTTKDPTYREVCSGRTGHVEAVQVEYNPAEVSFKQLLDVFWKKHDPTQTNRQVLCAIHFRFLAKY